MGFLEWRHMEFGVDTELRGGSESFKQVSDLTIIHYYFKTFIRTTRRSWESVLSFHHPSPRD